MSYVPTKDADLDLWALNWTTRVSATPTAFGLTAPIATACAALYTTWHAAFLAATNPATRTPVTVAAKDSAKGAMVPQLRLYSQQVKANAAVTNSQKEDLGIHVDDTIPTPIPPPSTAVIIGVMDIGVLNMNLRFSDQATPDSRSKPPGAIGCLLYKSIGTAPATDPDAANFEGLFTKIPLVVNFDAGDRGKTVTFFARWTNGKGQEGPWGSPVSRVIS